mgnify:CR=1 FL=1|jgi:hypothetical protein
MALPSPFSKEVTQAAEYILLPTNARSSACPPFTSTALAWWLHADLFRARSANTAVAQPPGGMVEPFGGPDFSAASPPARGVLWAVTQVYPCPSRPDWRSDCLDARARYFQRVLDTIALWVQAHGMTLTTLAVPRLCGCEQAPEQWSVYEKKLEAFASSTGITVLLTQALADCDDEAPYTRFAARVRAPAETAFHNMLLHKVRTIPIVLCGGGGRRGGRGATLSQLLQAHGGGPAATPMEVTTSTLSFLAAAGIQLQGGAAAPPPPAKRSRECSEDGAVATKRVRGAVTPPPPPSWTRESWYQTHMVGRFTDEEIARGQAMDQGDPEWVEFKEDCWTTSSFGKVRDFFHGKGIGKLNKALCKKVWHQRIDANKFMAWGSAHEDDGKAAGEAAMRHGLLARLAPCSQDMSVDPHETHWLGRMHREAETDPPDDVGWEVVEVMDSRGCNVDTVDPVMAYSYDGLYKVRPRAAGPEAPWEYVLMEVKCPSTMYPHPKDDHVAQMQGMVGGLQPQYPITRCVYVVYQRHGTRFWQLPFDEAAYAILRKQVLWVWFNLLLPLFVARDNGKLTYGTLEVAEPLGDITTSS